MKRMKWTILLIGTLLRAQETIAPTTDAPVGPAQGQNAAGYNIIQSWEVGYRFATMGGDEDQYRSNVNFGDGIRLLGSSLLVNSRDGQGRWFDDLSLTTAGLGHDPYESANLRVEKKGDYEYDMTWRENAYFNPGLTTDAGLHLMNTTYRWQDHELTLFSRRWYRVHAGYGRVTQDGPALTTQQEFDTTGDVFPVFRNLSEQFNDYRLGGEINAHGLRLTVMRRWEYFREDTGDSVTVPVTGALNPVPDASVLSSFSRAQPYRGRTPSWLGNLFYEQKLLTLDARLAYSGGRGDFVQNEMATGVDAFGGTRDQQIAVNGNGDRIATTGDFNAALLPNSRFTLTTGVSVSDTRTDGSNTFTQFDNANLSALTLNFQLLAIRLVTASATAHYRISKSWTIFAGMEYSDRQIRSIEDATTPGFPFPAGGFEQVNLLRAGSAGFNWALRKYLQVHAEAEIGRNNYPFAPISLRNYEAIRSRVRYRVKSITATASYQENYNSNSIVITSYASRSRNYSASASWNVGSRVSLDASYSKLHLDTIGGIAFFAAPLPAISFSPAAQSIYISNIHAGTFDARFAITSRLDFFAGYNITNDTGGAPVPVDTSNSAAAQLLESVQSFPFSYQTPLARVSWRINEKLRFNVGYQYYGYRETPGILLENQNYHAHTGYTSLLWSF